MDKLLALMFAMLLVIGPFWLMAGFPGVRRDLKEIRATTKRIEGAAWAGVYMQLTREDFEFLGVSEFMLYQTVGADNYRLLMERWYGPCEGGYSAPAELTGT